MDPLPWHPLVVHVPLALAVLLPFLAAACAWAIRSDRVRPGAWVAIVALQAVLVGSGVVATNTGRAEEERVERIVPDSAIHEHEEAAEMLVWAAGGTLALAGLVLIVGEPRWSRALTLATLLATVVVAGLGIRAGDLGGRLVYVHGAAAAYASPSGTGSSEGGPQRRDERDERLP